MEKSGFKRDMDTEKFAFAMGCLLPWQESVSYFTDPTWSTLG